MPKLCVLRRARHAAIREQMVVSRDEDEQLGEFGGLHDMRGVIVAALDAPGWTKAAGVCIVPDRSCRR